MALGDPMGDAGWNDVGTAVAYIPSAYNQSQNPSNINDLLGRLEAKVKSGDEAALDKLFNYVASEASAKTARDWTAQREDTAYQRLVNDLQKAGISPYILSGASPFAGAAPSNSYSGSQFTSQQTANYNKAKAQDELAANFTKAILSFLGTALVAMAMFA